MAAGLKISQTNMLSCRIAVLHGPGVLGEHCVLENLAGTVTLIPKEGALCSVNGSVVTGPSQLTQGEDSKAAYPSVHVSSPGMNGGSTGQIPSTTCFEWQRPCSKLQTKPQALQLIGRWGRRA